MGGLDSLRFGPEVDGMQAEAGQPDKLRESREFERPAGKNERKIDASTIFLRSGA
jgi:hypothetical protein